MGYRTRLGKVSKKDHEKYKDSESFRKSYNPDFHTQLYEIGKYFHYTEHRKPFYNKFNIAEEHESEFDILDKEGLEGIIKVFEGYIRDWFNKATEYDKENYFKSIKREWVENIDKFDLAPYSLDPKQEMVKSWKYEYTIFQLVHIYRSFDWDNDLLIYSAW